MFPQSLNFEPINTEQYCTSGDVTIFPGAAIAPGVLLQADVGSRIVIRAGVCIGLGSVIHATQGTITIHDGANLGAGVLLIGNVTIGARACLGTAVTVINRSVEARSILESGTVVGDRSRKESTDDLLAEIPMNSHHSVNSSNSNYLSNSGYSSNPANSSNSSYSSNSIHSSNPANSSNTLAVNTTTSAVSNGFYPIATVEFAQTQTASEPIELKPIEPEPIPNPNPSDLTITPLAITPTISTFQYPDEPKLDLTAPAIVLDNSGQPWQTCDPNPWDPTDRPMGETTCQITSKPQESTPYNPTLFSSQTHASSYPPYPHTETISTFKYPDSPNTAKLVSNPVSEPIAAPPPQPIQQPTEPQAVYGQDYVNQMLGKLTGR